MRKLISAALFAVLGATAAHASPVNLITNGSFENYTGTLNGSGWAHLGAAAIDGWTGDPNVEIQTQPTLGITPQDGLAYVELDTSRNASLSQTVTLDAGRYEFSFYYRPRVNNPGGDNNDMRYTALGTGVMAGGLIQGAPNPDFPINEWVQVALDFAVGADNTDVTFSFFALGASGRGDGERCGNCGALVDNVRLAPVPLPAGILLLLSAVGGFAALRRRA